MLGTSPAPASGGPVEVRYIELRAVPPTAPRGRVRIHADTDARSVHWLLRKGSSVVASGTGGRTIRFRAPAKPGRYLLVAAAGSHQARTTLVVAKS